MRTYRGRVVYDRKIHQFRVSDVIRIARHVEFDLEAPEKILTLLVALLGLLRNGLFALAKHVLVWPSFEMAYLNFLRDLLLIILDAAGWIGSAAIDWVLRLLKSAVGVK